VLFAFDLQMAGELEGQNINYETEMSIGPEYYTLTYFVYAAP